MTSSVSKGKGASVLLAVLGLTYPFAVYMSWGRVPAGLLVVFALVLAGARLGLVRGSAAARQLCMPLGIVALATAAMGLIEAEAAAKAYPVLMSLGFAAAFGVSLLRPPTLVEVFASLREPCPSAAARRYMRRVTGIWFCFLLANAAVSLGVTVWGSDWWWALYNGLLSYLLMALLFGGEWLVRRRVRMREGAP
jgi:Predicted membrane protein